MLCLLQESNDPFFNLAIEENLLKKSSEEFLILGINSPSVIIGKHQSPYREINIRFAIENNIPVIRRISGGGTVFHDSGNLNFTFIMKSEAGRQVDFYKYTRPVIDFLSSAGVEAKFEGKNDIRVGGYKISGNAEHVHRNRVLHHGTLLFSTDLDMLRNSLRKESSCYTTRGVRSNPSSVTNLNELLGQFKDIYDFRSEMMDFFLRNIDNTSPYQLSHSETEEAESLAASKYRTWEWNWAYGPKYHFVNNFLSENRQIQCHFFVRDGIIMECELEGSSELTIVGKKLIGRRHMVAEFLEIFNKENISITDREIYNFF